MSAFGGLLRAHREWAGLTQRHLADLTTLSERAIRDLECGRARRPRPATVRLLADGLDLRGGVRTAFLASARDTAPVTPGTGLLGRDEELSVLAELLGDDGDRVVTITGVAGVGKTRLAMAAAARLPGPVVLCEHDDTPPGAVLVLDGPSPAVAAAVLRNRPGARLLCAARAPLGLPGERVVPLLPLGVPEGTGLAEVAASPSARLLLRYIRALDPGFRLDPSTVEAIAGICVLVDGLPGALARAGEACALRPVHLVYRRLADDPGDLSASLELLPGPELALLDRLSRRTEPWTVDEVSADPAAVHTLLRHGLLRRSGPARFRVLGLVQPQPVGAA
jgi:transcriptional regulator with XRE-family HTH domain